MSAVGELLEQAPDQVRAVLNILQEAPYFYRSDNQSLFHFLRRHRPQFDQFYQEYYGWSLVVDDKCARLYKSRWYNRSITEANRDMFNFRRRDECLAFMFLLEFFEQQLEENSMTVDDRENLHFRLVDLLLFVHRRFGELFPDDAGTRYTEEYVHGNLLRQVLPVLEKYRFVSRLKPPEGIELEQQEAIFEALPALYHYSAVRLAQPVGDRNAAPNRASMEDGE